MTNNPTTHHRRSIRLPQFDYAQPGVYFVTICTHQRECTLGEIVDGVMMLNEWGNIADRYWIDLAVHFPGIAIATHVVMPNHTHANIVMLNHQSDPCRGGVAPPRVAPPLQPTLGQIVAFYKYQTTKAINLLREMPGARFWQRSYWEHVVRNAREMRRIEEYIQDNPARWSDDQLHPSAPPNAFNKD